MIPRVALLLVASSVPDEGRIVFMGNPGLVRPGFVSTSKSEIKITFSPDGERMLWGTIGWEGGAGGWDIWESRLEGGQWSKPAPVSSNSSQNDFDPYFAPDGRGVYFFSNRAGGVGGDDIWFAAFDPERGAYSPAENLGPHMNSTGDEWAPILSSDGKRILFASDGRGGRGLHDRFTSERKDGALLPAEPLPGSVNSTDDDFDAILLEKDSVLVSSR
ncbi:MAG: PD40 domain-containing protein [Acidobacteria bacterium]|nr:PD40 domain-containing protein [Acidobacteriota bacterium]